MHNQWSAAHNWLLVALNQLPPPTNYLLNLHNRLPRLGYWLPQMPNPVPPPTNHLLRLCNGLPVRNNGLAKMYDYLSRALYWWFSALQKRSAGMLSHF